MASLNRPAAAAAPAELSSGLIGNTPDVGKPVFAHFEISKATGTCHLLQASGCQVPFRICSTGTLAFDMLRYAEGCFSHACVRPPGCLNVVGALCR